MGNKQLKERMEAHIDQLGVRHNYELETIEFSYENKYDYEYNPYPETMGNKQLKERMEAHIDQLGVRHNYELDTIEFSYENKYDYEYNPYPETVTDRNLLMYGVCELTNHPHHYDLSVCLKCESRCLFGSEALKRFGPEPTIKKKAKKR